jgi:hypothetical protein
VSTDNIWKWLSEVKYTLQRKRFTIIYLGEKTLNGILDVSFYNMQDWKGNRKKPREIE